MDAGQLTGLTTPFQILVVDLLLGADNALMIGLACRALPPVDRKRATAIGVVGAIGLRLVMSALATSLLALPLVKLIGALLLLMIAINLAEEDGDELAAFERASGESRLWSAAAVIVLADATMSLDNVVALAAIAQGSYLWLLIGVALSLPLLGYGGLMVADWLHRAPGLIALGSALLGWIAGGMAVSDPLWGGWIDANAPGLSVLAPLLGAAFVYLHGRLAPRSLAAPRPKPAPRAEQIKPAPRPKPVAAAPQVEPAPVEARSAEDKVVLVGVVALFLIAAVFIALVSYYGGLEQ